jgi:undecaprenyl-diphosphatase
MRWTDALKVGFAQAFALVPGHVALRRDDHRRDAVRVVAARRDGVLVLPGDPDAARCNRPTSSSRIARYFPRTDLPAFGVGFVARSSRRSVCVRWLIRYVSHHDFVPFAWYRIAVREA